MTAICMAAARILPVLILSLAGPATGAPATVAPAPPALLPQPAVMRIKAGVYTPPRHPLVSVPRHDPAAARAARWLGDEAGRIGGLSLRFGASAPAIRFSRELRTELGPEGYTLDIDAKGVRIAARTDAGLMRGAASLLQLLTPTGEAGQNLSLPYLHIEDRPRFAWRGLMLDSARHMQSVGFIERLLDQMARYKLNVFHWHLTDDQGWRLPIREYPKLTTVGAWRVEAGRPHALDLDPKTGKPRLYGGFYTRAQVREIVAYAKDRGIEVAPEIEIPGHATAALVAYPELGVRTADAKTMGDWGVFPNLYAPSPKTEAFLKTVLAETMALFPGRYVHVGGDEAVKDYWKTSPEVQAKMKSLGVKSEDALQSWLINRVGRYLAEHGRRLIGWDEVLQGGLPAGAAIMSWHGVAGALAAARAGHDAVLTPGVPFYFDNRLSAAADEPPGRGLVIPLRAVYDFDPGAPPIDRQTLAHILGVEATLWTEHIRLDERVEHMAFPRAAAVAEMGWSPQAARDWTSFTARLGPAMRRDEAMGLKPAKSALAPLAPPTDPLVRDNHQLALCSEAIALNLEAPGPVGAVDRPTYLADIANPCWIWKDAELSGVAGVVVDAALMPFNFQIGADAAKVPLRPARTPEGEFEVRQDSCDGPLLASLPMPKTAEDPRARVRGALTTATGRHDLCLRFTRPALDPWWALGSIRLTKAVTP